MERTVRDGKIAVVHSDDWGSGWYSVHGISELLFDSKLVSLVESNASHDAIAEYCRQTYAKYREIYPDEYFFNHSLAITWIPAGSKFWIHEYDGRETVITEQSMKDWWITT